MDFKRKFYTTEESIDEKIVRLDMLDQFGIQVNVIQKIISSPLPGIEKLDGLIIRHQFKESVILYRAFLDIVSLIYYENMIFKITSFETKPHGIGIGSKLFQITLESIADIIMVVKNLSTNINKVMLIGELSVQDKRIGYWDESLPKYNYFAQKYDMNFGIANCKDLNDNVISESYLDYCLFEQDCNSGKFYMEFTKNTLDLIEKYRF